MDIDEGDGTPGRREDAGRAMSPPGGAGRPRAGRDGAYCAVIGGSEVSACGLERPFTVQVAEMTGWRVVDLGVRHGGPDALLGDAARMATAAGAEVAVVQAPGAHALSNRFYTVHPRRNDRFLRPSEALARLYPEVDFTDFTFVRHLLVTLSGHCPHRFATVAEELRSAWTARMLALTAALPGRLLLLDIRHGGQAGLGPEPFLVTGDMIGRLREHVDAVISCDVTDAVSAARVTAPRGGAAASTQSVHDAIASALAPVLGRRDGLAA